MMKALIAIPATAALVYRAWSRNSLTPLGIVTAIGTAVAHAVHPWSVFFALLVVFFLSGTAVTKVKHDVKARLTHSASGAPGGEGPRTHVQVLANSVVASILILAHTWKISGLPAGSYQSSHCWAARSDPLVVGIVANYAAVAADTFSSELGILSRQQPRLITNPFRSVSPGTNGGVTPTGLLAGLLGSFIISLTAILLVPFCESSRRTEKIFHDTNADWTLLSKGELLLGLTFLGFCGTLVDSYLGATLQASVIDVRSGKIIEGTGGKKVKVHGPETVRLRQQAGGHSDNGPKGSAADRQGRASSEGTHVNRPSREIISGKDLLDNNGVNLAMAAIVSIGGMTAASFIWNVPIFSF